MDGDEDAKHFTGLELQQEAGGAFRKLRGFRIEHQACLAPLAVETVDVRVVFEPLFVTYGVNVVFSGHDHIYERLTPQKGIYYFVEGAAGELRKGGGRVRLQEQPFQVLALLLPARAAEILNGMLMRGFTTVRDAAGAVRLAAYLEDGVTRAYLGLVAVSDQRLRRFGALASAKATNEDGYLVQKLCRAVMGTNNVDHCTRLCHSPSVEAMLASMGSGATSNSYVDYEEAGCLMVVGADASANHPVIAIRFRRAMKRGARIIVVNPKRVELCDQADLWIQQRPGQPTRLEVKRGAETFTVTVFLPSEISGIVTSICCPERRMR